MHLTLRIGHTAIDSWHWTLGICNLTLVVSHWFLSIGCLTFGIGHWMQRNQPIIGHVVGQATVQVGEQETKVFYSPIYRSLDPIYIQSHCSPPNARCRLSVGFQSRGMYHSMLCLPAAFTYVTCTSVPIEKVIGSHQPK